MRSIQYITYLAAGLILFVVSGAVSQTEQFETSGIHFAPPGQSIANQDLRRPEEVGLRPEIIYRLKDKMQDGHWALWRHGYLVHQEGDFNKNIEVKSLRKTWHALTVGAAVKQNRIPSVHQKISVWCKELTAKDALATWQHVITQTSGFDYPYGTYPAYEPGQLWTYSDKNPKYLCNALAQVYGKQNYADDYEDVVSRAYFDAIGMRGWTTSVRSGFLLWLEASGRTNR